MNKILLKIIVKSIIYRFYSLFITFIIVWAITGEFILSGYLTVIVETTKVLNYILFELIYKKIQK